MLDEEEGNRPAKLAPPPLLTSCAHLDPRLGLDYSMDNSIQLQQSSKAASLSPEILSGIFQHLDWPCAFPLVCKTWCSVVDTHTLSNFILQRYGRSEAIYKAIACGRKRCTGALLRQLIRSGANLAMQLCLAVAGDHSSDWRHAMPWLNFGWTERLPAEAFQTLKAVAEEQFEIPFKDLLARGSEEIQHGILLSFSAWEDALCRTREVNVDVELVEPLRDPKAEQTLEALWLKFETSLTR